MYQCNKAYNPLLIEGNLTLSKFTTKMSWVFVLFVLLGYIQMCVSASGQTCDAHQTQCKDSRGSAANSLNKYTQGQNTKWLPYLTKIEDALASYTPCDSAKCSCHYPLIKKDLDLFKNGINKDTIQSARDRGTFYQIINKNLYRQKDCLFPSRCSGIEHFILKIIDTLPDMEMVINTRDWPQIHRHFGEKKPVFSFSKTAEYVDITYPAWTFWEGGPAITLYPMGLGRWDLLRTALKDAAEQWPWEKKKPLAFFRGSRTSSERDSLVYLSREEPDLVDAQYTKNQAWKSDADTLYAPPASEVPLEEHCHYKHLFNFRGVAASFRFKHLFLCGSLVYHMGDEWIEFFYPKMEPWVHYIPVRAGATKEEIRTLLKFAGENEEVVSEIAKRGHDFIRNQLRMKDVLCYWRKLLRSYARLLKYEPQKEEGLVKIRPKS